MKFKLQIAFKSIDSRRVFCAEFKRMFGYPFTPSRSNGEYVGYFVKNTAQLEVAKNCAGVVIGGFLHS